MTGKRYKLSEPNGAYLVDGDKPCAHWINNDDKIIDLLNDLVDENKQLKKDNTDLMMVLKNQSIIIQELYSKLLEYELKEPKESIVLTKEDLEIMGKAISYYTHGRCGE